VTNQYDLYRYIKEKAYYGRGEVLMMITARLIASEKDGLKRLGAIQEIQGYICSFQLTLRPCSLGPGSKDAMKYKRVSFFFPLALVQRQIIFVVPKARKHLLREASWHGCQDLLRGREPEGSHFMSHCDRVHRSHSRRRPR
jgi:hypothetical protein